MSYYSLHEQFNAPGGFKPKIAAAESALGAPAFAVRKPGQKVAPSPGYVPSPSVRVSTPTVSGGNAPAVKNTPPSASTQSFSGVNRPGIRRP